MLKFMEQKKNYYKQMEEIIAENSALSKKPSLLLHACCGPCSSAVIELLSDFFKITIFYYNPNIFPPEEYSRRKNELSAFLEKFPPAKKTQIQLVEAPYNPEDFFEATGVREETYLQSEPEKGERCKRCYQFRMKCAYEYATKNQFDYFTTTLSISPHKDSEKINTIGKLLEIPEKTKFLPSDFKKKNGFLRSLQLSAEYDMYRQDYCGCVYSKQNRGTDV